MPETLDAWVKLAAPRLLGSETFHPYLRGTMRDTNAGRHARVI